MSDRSRTRRRERFASYGGGDEVLLNRGRAFPGSSRMVRCPMVPTVLGLGAGLTWALLQDWLRRSQTRRQGCAANA